MEENKPPLFKDPTKKVVGITQQQYLDAAKECEKEGRFQFHIRVAKKLGITRYKAVYLQTRFGYKPIFALILSPKRQVIFDRYKEYIEKIGLRGALANIAKELKVSRQCVEQCVASAYKQLGLSKPKYIPPEKTFKCSVCGNAFPMSDRKRFQRCSKCEKEGIKRCHGCNRVMPLKEFCGVKKIICKGCNAKRYNEWRKRILAENGELATAFRKRSNQYHKNWEKNKRLEKKD